MAISSPAFEVKSPSAHEPSNVRGKTRAKCAIKAPRSKKCDSHRKVESRRKLTHAARILFAEKGYHQTQIEDITALAGVGNGTFYRHFEDKLDCFAAFAGEISHEITEIVRWHAPESEEFEETLTSMVKVSGDYTLANPGVLRAAFSDIRVFDHEQKLKLNESKRWWIKLINQWKDEGHISTEIDTFCAVQFLNGVMTQHDLLLTLDPKKRVVITKSITHLLVRALRP